MSLEIATPHFLNGERTLLPSSLDIKCVIPSPAAFPHPTDNISVP